MMVKKEFHDNDFRPPATNAMPVTKSQVCTLPIYSSLFIHTFVYIPTSLCIHICSYIYPYMSLHRHISPYSYASLCIPINLYVSFVCFWDIQTVFRNFQSFARYLK